MNTRIYRSSLPSLTAWSYSIPLLLLSLFYFVANIIFHCLVHSSSPLQRYRRDLIWKWFENDCDWFENYARTVCRCVQKNIICCVEEMSVGRFCLWRYNFSSLLFCLVRTKFVLITFYAVLLYDVCNTVWLEHSRLRMASYFNKHKSRLLHSSLQLGLCLQYCNVIYAGEEIWFETSTSP